MKLKRENMASKPSVWSNFYKDNKLYIMAFLLPFITMLVLFMANSIYPFGNRSFLNIDMYHQYFPFLTDFFHKIKSGESLSYAWNAGIGSNFVALYAYYLATPFNWLCFWVPEAFLMEFLSYLVVFKIGLCGLTCCIYLSNHFKTKNFALVLFSLFYAMSGYMAAYNWNVMWLDCMVLAPIIILGLEALAKEGKYKLYCLSLGLAIISNYYICIMICIYLVLYFLIVLLPQIQNEDTKYLSLWGKNILSACMRFAVFSLLAGGIGALLLIPEIMALRLSRFTSSTFPETLKEYFSLFDVLARHFINVEIETGLDHWPNIYCSVAVIILFPLYIMNKKINSKGKISNIVLLLIMLLSFSYNMSTFVWHGWNYPDSLPARQSFLYILLLLTVCTEVFLHFKEISKKELTASFVTAFVFILLCQKLVTDDAFTPKTYLLSGIFLLVYCILLHVFHNCEKTPLYLTCLLVFVVVVEAGSNTLLTSLSTVSRPNYLANYDTYNELSNEQMQEEEEGVFYRYEKISRTTNNDSMLQNYPSLSLFSSTSNGLVNYFYNRYGMRNSKVYYCAEGVTPFTSALLSQGYTFSKKELPEDSLYSLIKEKDGVYLYKNTYSVPLGFCIAPNEIMEDFLIDDKDTAISVVAENENDGRLPINRQNALAFRLGAYDDLFSELPSEDNAGYSTIDVIYDTHVYAYCNTTKVKEITAYIGEEELKTFKKLNNKYIMDLGYHTAGTRITLRSETEKLFNMTAYSLDEECLSDLVSTLNQNTMYIDEMDSDTLKGTVSADEDGYLVLSIPYDPGFTIMVDGEQTEAYLFEDMMIAVPITAGTHSISLEYFPQGMIAGILISVISLGLFVMICMLERRKKQI